MIPCCSGLTYLMGLLSSFTGQIHTLLVINRLHSQKRSNKVITVLYAIILSHYLLISLSACSPFSRGILGVNYLQFPGDECQGTLQTALFEEEEEEEQYSDTGLLYRGPFS
uniref:Mitochondrial genome maintenance exonuclease 1 n=1 Tax=Schistocephalus solidus TaxID=70667 RepID=A0A0X3QFV8_SCHSO